MCNMMNKYLDNMFGSENNISEIELMIAEDETFCNSRVANKMNRANRRRKNAEKKVRLGKEYRHSKEHIDAYWTEKVQDGNNTKKVTHWVDKDFNGMTIEECYEYINSIPWEKVKGINPKKMGYAEYLRGSHQWNRKARHQKFAEDRGDFFEEDVIDPYTGELLAEKGEPIRPLEFSNEDKEHLWKMFHRLNPEDREEELFLMGFNKDYEFEGFDFHDPEMYQDRRLNEKLISARRLIKAYKDLLELELHRATLMSLVHEVDWKIRIAVAEFNKANRNCK